MYLPGSIKYYLSNLPRIGALITKSIPMLVNFVSFVNLTQAKIIWEEGTSFGKKKKSLHQISL